MRRTTHARHRQCRPHISVGGIALWLAKCQREPRQRCLRIAGKPERVGIGPSQLQRIDVDLHARRCQRGNAPGVCDLITRMTACEQDQVRLMHNLVGWRRAIVAGTTDRQPMVSRDDPARAEGCGDRRRQCFG
jgi:hypothetical protein